MRILIVEDEFNLADVISAGLKNKKYEVDIANDGEDGLYYALSNSYDVIILDVMLPKMNGYDILKEIRTNNVDSKVIMLTAKSELEDKVNGFDLGADDYLTKPFHMTELILRIKALCRRSTRVEKDILRYGDIELDTNSLTIKCTKTNDSIITTGKEYQLLELFVRNKNNVISKEQIYDKVWGIESEIESNNLEAYLSFIRKKLKLIGSKVNIKSMRNIGYKIEGGDND